MELTASNLSKNDLVLLMETIEMIEKINSKEDYFNIIPQINNLVPFGVFSHALFDCKRNDQGILKVIDMFQVGTYPEEWIARYVENNYAQVDPIVTQNILNLSEYQRWQDTYKIIHPPKEFQMEAEDFGLEDGATIGGFSIRRPEFSLFCLSGKEMEHNDRTKYIVQRLVNIFHQAIKRARANELKPGLTLQQKIILDYLKRGMSQKLIADEMCLGPDRIKAVVSEISKILDTENAVNSVYMAMRHGEI